MMKYKHIRPLLLALFIAGSFAPLPLFAASLYFSPSTITLSKGESVTVTLRVGSTDQSINAVSGSFSVPGFFSVQSVSKTNSILNFWTTEPTASGDTVSFEGVALGSGYQGPNGVVMSVTLTAKQSGAGTVSLDNASVLANDGKGTNVLSSLGVLSLSASDSSVAPSHPAVPLRPGVPAIPIVASATNPDQNQWSANKNPSFSWNLPADVTAIRLLYNETPDSIPAVLYTTPISSKTLTNVSDGIHYLHVQFKNASGWGGITHFKFNIDTTPPKQFQITFPHGATGLNPQPIILFNTTDSLSGIDHYDVQVGNGGPLATAASADSNPYSLPAQDPGNHVVVVTAYDKAGNSTQNQADFTIQGIDPPIVTSYPGKIAVGDVPRIRGTTYPNGTVDVEVRQDGSLLETETAKSNELGDWALIISKRLGPGAYTFAARVTDNRGARSDFTKSYQISVDFSFFTDATLFLINYFFIVIVFMVALLVLAAFGVWSWFKLRRLVHIMKKEHAEAQLTLHRSFKLLRHDLSDHLVRLKKTPTAGRAKKELAYLQEFEKNLSDAEHFITDEMEDVIPKR